MARQRDRGYRWAENRATPQEPLELGNPDFLEGFSDAIMEVAAMARYESDLR